MNCRDSKKMLNVGCGPTFNPDWENIDFVSMSPCVRALDLRKGLPYPANHFEVCYSSHVLEHLTPSEAKDYVAEMFRVLKPGGVIRLVVPDFERVARDYLQCLARLANGDRSAEDDYDWMIIQMMDQSVRKWPGGEMSKFWRDAGRENKTFVIERAGMEAENVINKSRSGVTEARRSLWKRITSRTCSWHLEKVRLEIAKVMVLLVAGKSAKESFVEGLFRNSGEIHNWVYDAYSLARLLNNSGFLNMSCMDAFTSQVEGFSDFGLDLVGGRVRKPDSLFMEAMKPS